ncbi:MAG: isocitrate lyase/PEP mutase family protein [Steroidobacteraceae bacterium]
MNGQKAKAGKFRELHRQNDPLVLFNIWDAGSAGAVAEAGAKALATSSWAVAAAHGYEDGEKMPWAVALENYRHIVSATELPVTVDVEGGYGDVSRTVGDAISAGAVGLNLEDLDSGSKKILPIAEQSERIRQARAAADGVVGGAFLNARTDVFLWSDKSAHTNEMLEKALARAEAYAKSGADGFFVPGLADPEKIARLCARSPLPVNVMIGHGETPIKTLATLGVSRISYGPSAYLLAMKALKEAAAALV